MTDELREKFERRVARVWWKNLNAHNMRQLMQTSMFKVPPRPKTTNTELIDSATDLRTKEHS